MKKQRGDKRFRVIGAVRCLNRQGWIIDVVSVTVGLSKWRDAHREREKEREREERRTPWRRVILFVKILEGDEEGRNRFNSGLTVSKDSLLFLPSPLGWNIPRVPGEKIQERLLESRRRER